MQNIRRDHSLIEGLKRKRIRNVTFDGRTLTVNFDGKHLRSNVSVKESVRWVGSWKGRNIRVDDDLNLIEGFAVAVHEVIEEDLYKTLRRNGFSEADAQAYSHEIADEAEWTWARKHTSLKRGEYTRKVERVFRKEMAYAGEEGL